MLLFNVVLDTATPPDPAQLAARPGLGVWARSSLSERTVFWDCRRPDALARRILAWLAEHDGTIDEIFVGVPVDETPASLPMLVVRWGVIEELRVWLDEPSRSHVDPLGWWQSVQRWLLRLTRRALAVERQAAASCAAEASAP